MSHHFVSGEGILWAQIDGPNTQPYLLGCHQLGDVDEPQGDVELIYCPDPSGPSRFRVVNSVQGAAGAVTTSITTDVTDELDYLERGRCAVPIYVHMSKAGRKDVFTNYDRSFVLTNARVTSRGLTGLTARTPDDNARAEMTFELSAEELVRVVRLSLNRQTLTETLAVNDLTFCNGESCRTTTSAGMDVCQIGFAAVDATVGVAANVLYTSNGADWAATAVDPFGTAENVTGVECFELGRDTTRVIVARGSADAGAPAEIAFSDDNGATWTSVNAGATNGQYAPSAQSLHAFDRNNLWLGTQDGYIYYSDDAGLTWAAQDSGVINTGVWNAIHFSDELTGYAVGAANAIAKTIDGGESWSVVTGPSANAAVAATSLFVLDRNRAWVGYANGTLYYTLDGGTTWTQRSFAGSGVGQVRSIKFINEYVGVMARNNASPVGTVLMTIDGGFTWETVTTPTNSGLNSVYVCSPWRFYVAGEANGGTGFIGKGDI
jgi:photosystem II stability/assembly factor-like uncharacterized protein